MLMKRRLSLIATVLALIASPVVAQTAGPVNPSTLTWTAPTTNADATPLLDLGDYRIRCVGPLPVVANPTFPAYTPSVYPVKATKPSTVQAPLANTSVAFGTAGSNNLAGDLGLTTDGQYGCLVTAVDLVGNESGVQATPAPFSRNRVAPAVVPGVQVNP